MRRPRALTWRQRLIFPSVVSLAAMALAALPLVLPGTSGEAAAQVAVGVLDQIVNSFARAQAFEAGLLRAAENLFLGLSAISFVLVGRHYMRRDLDDIIGFVIGEALRIGFFYFILVNGGLIFRSIVATFGILANDASLAAGGSQNMSPSDVLGIGINTTSAIWKGLSIYSPVQSFLLTLAGIAVIGSYAFLTALLIEVLVEAQIMAAVATFYFAFGGAAHTQDIAVAMLRSALAIGTKRLFIQVQIGLTEVLMRDLATGALGTAELNYTTLALLISIPLILTWLCRTLPARAQAILQGTYVGANSSLGAAATGLAAAAAKAATAVAGAGAATTAAMREARTSMESREIQSGSAAPTSIAGQAARNARIAGMAAGNMARAIGSDVGQRLTGDYRANHGGLGWRAAQSMRGRAQVQQSKNDTARRQGQS